MLIQRFINTLPIEKMKNLKIFDVGQMNFDRKRTEEGKINKRVSSQKHRMRKEEGATVAATPYLLLSWLLRIFRRAVLGSKQRHPMH
jgi:hypothetical protein